MEQSIINSDKFWETIEKANKLSQGNLDMFTKLIEKELSSWSYSQLYHFQIIYEEYELATVKYANNLIWSALILINKGYCTNTYGFAGWLISQGKNTYLETLKNPDYLAKTDASKDKCNYEGIRFVAINLAKEKMKGKIKQKTEEMKPLWESDIFKSDQIKINSEIEYGNLNRNRDWKLKEMEPLLPDLYNKHVAKKRFWGLF